MRHTLRSLSILGIAMAFSGCASTPIGISAVDGFKKERYLGVWYEIARFDFAFERNLNNTTATYTSIDSGYIGVINRGYNYKTSKWSQVKGKARFKGSDATAELKVSFFGPFYADYTVIALDADYRYALVAGSSTKYLWILSREKAIPDDIKIKYLALAASLGYVTDDLIWVEHSN